MNCIFCKIAKGEIPSYKVWENKKFLVFLDIKPLNPGHILIITKKHNEDIFLLEDYLYNEIFELVKKLVPPLKNTTNAKKIGLVVEGFDVKHLHIHLIPINKPNDLNSERAKVATKIELEQMKTILLKAFNKI